MVGKYSCVCVKRYVFWDRVLYGYIVLILQTKNSKYSNLLLHLLPLLLLSFFYTCLHFKCHAEIYTTQWCQLAKGQTGSLNYEQMCVSKSRMSFDLAPTGEVLWVYHPRGENHTAVSIKKMLLGTISSKLVVSSNTDRWGYRVNETGHEGRLWEWRALQLEHSAL